MREMREMRKRREMLKGIIIHVVVLILAVISLVLRVLDDTTPMKEARPISGAPETTVGASSESNSLSEDPYDQLPWSDSAELTCVSNYLGSKELIRPLKGASGEDEWYNQTLYVLRLNLPDPLPAMENSSSLCVIYPNEVKAGEPGIITATIITDGVQRAPAYYNFVARTDLYITTENESSAVDPAVSKAIWAVEDDGLGLQIAMRALSEKPKDQPADQKTVKAISGTGGTLNVAFFDLSL